LIVNNFQHQHFAHCESGVVSLLLKSHGLELSEPMVFGVSGALGFAYLPFFKFGNMPVISYRMFPGHIIKNLPKKLGIQYFRKTYRSQQKAMDELTEFIMNNQVVGIQTSAYFTTYFPPDMRFQFNAHNTIVIGKEDDEFIISDPVFESIKRIKSADLQKARFAKGFSAPKGLVHYPVHIPQSVENLDDLIITAIKKTVRMMLYTPIPLIGIRGINYLAKHIEKLSYKNDSVHVRQFLGNVVRMQEEIGTGGAGFRFIYAAFLQEAGDKLQSSLLKDASAKMTQTGDLWRTFALACAKAVKNKDKSAAVDTFPIARLLRQCADAEKEIYLMLKNI